ncbi:pppGpp 5'-phosphohydrolase and exopolyphosphatase, putative [Syntrophotalea carbinolica DSM 2380]|uniref:PppGpp 5'-phosphohydrolase and exopolyphosphatase, putative n=1 Tax=Syntrophotalea carbinolica (strain DSM 2380 / NBRC 103641 / GraBd1) TaxID=338963 RepID=Q3A496_SYNC1|nr:pppGpp 5'-phosphohydrolase and exopolyphosphatase [Syntrophotalea carbinolica]ABA88811.1 pppGpp 5'-phosphohydrolase and exopolyphosphatase, putative [Syntrophotalea carbinolica DSM 2380]
MLAGVDVGSNTVRLLLGEVCHGIIKPVRYVRHITRLAGNYDPRVGLARQSMDHTFNALLDLQNIIAQAGVEQVRVVGTEALRRAPNADEFVSRVQDHAGIRLEIIDGEEEARLSCAGMIAALAPPPESCLMFDIGGGSTELIFSHKEKVLFKKSYPLGVVELCEMYPEDVAQQRYISKIFSLAVADLKKSSHFEHAMASDTLLVGTAGTVTSLAAMKLRMIDYDGLRINNQVLFHAELTAMLKSLSPMSVEQREQLAGLEKGRGDLIVPGLRITLALLDVFGKNMTKVSDFGLLEGVLLQMASRQFVS